MRANQFITGYVSKEVRVESTFTDYELAVMEGGLSLDKPKSALHQAVTNEGFDQPYPLTWEDSEFGDTDALARLPDGSNLSIMFNRQQGDEGEEAVQVEFYRNNSQEVTGEGDAQKVFATVLTAIQQYIKKHNPLKLTFSASKEVDPGQNSQSRANLYDRLVQRYARTWGYRAFRADNGKLVIYELSRLKPVAENFADGKNPEHKGDSKRHGIPKHATLSQLDKISHEGGRRGQLAHWQANMRRGRAKTESEILEGSEQDYLLQIANLDWKPVNRSVWNTIQDEGLDEEQDAPNHTDWVMASLSISLKDAQALQSFDSDTIEDFNRFDIHLKFRYPGLTDLIDYDNGTVTIVKPVTADLEEGWKDWVAGAALGAAALSPQAADAKVNPQQKPAITQQVQGDANYATKLILKPEAKILIQTARAAGMRGKELAQFVAQCAHETANFSSLKELGGRLDFKKYDPKHNPRKAKMLGNKQVGDGAKYHGRGYIQLTGRDNYKRAGQALGLPLEEQPELVERPEVAAKVAVWFWQNQVAPKVSNFSDTAQVTKPINSGLKGLDDRHNKFASIMALMGQKS